jgi:hypothetical protein
MIAWTTDYSNQIIVGFTTQSTFQLRLPAGDDNNSFLNVTVHIRDMLNSVTKYNMQTIVVLPDSTEITALIDVVQQPGNEANSNLFVQLLASGNQNTVGQILTSLSRIFNKMSTENVESAVASEYSSIISNFNILLLK